MKGKLQNTLTICNRNVKVITIHINLKISKITSKNI